MEKVEPGIERVAQAIYEANWYESQHVPWKLTTRTTRKAYYEMAEAAAKQLQPVDERITELQAALGEALRQRDEWLARANKNILERIDHKKHLLAEIRRIGCEGDWPGGSTQVKLVNTRAEKAESELQAAFEAGVRAAMAIAVRRSDELVVQTAIDAADSIARAIAEELLPERDEIAKEGIGPGSEI